MGFPSSAGGVSEADLTAAISDVLGTATAAGDTLGELETSLGGKALSAHIHAQSDITNLTTDLAAKAPLASPALTGTPTAPTAVAGTNTTQVATTAFVGTAVSNLVASSPAALDTLNELATALGNDANFSTTVTNALAAKAPLANPALTGTPTAPTAAIGTDTTQIATTAFANSVAPKTKVLTTDFVVASSTTLVAVTGLQHSVSNGKKYLFEADLDITSGSTGGAKFTINGTGTVNTSLSVGSVVAETYASPPTNLAYARRTDLTITGASSFTGQGSARAQMRFCFTATSDGTIAPYFSQAATHGVDSKVESGSWSRLTEIP